MKQCCLVVTIAVLNFSTHTTLAQDAASSYPSRTVELVVPFPAGGGLDLVARLIGKELSLKWGKPVVVQNRPGAGGSIGASTVARSTADGHTLLVTPTNAIVLAPYAFDNIGYEPADLTAVSTLVSLPQILVVPANSPLTTLPDLLAYAKANPGKLNVGSSGKGSGQHMAAQLLLNLAKVKMTDVPYRGSAPAIAAVVAGEIDLLFADPAASLPHVERGRLRALGVSTKDRVGSLPDVPAIGEVVAGYEAASYYAVFAPSATPHTLQDKINADVAEAFRQPAIMEQLATQGMQLRLATAEQSQSFVQSEAQKWGNLIKATGINLK